MLYIEIAYRGHIQLLEKIFGKGEDTPSSQQVTRGADGNPITLTPNVFDVHFGDGPRTPRRKMN